MKSKSKLDTILDEPVDVPALIEKLDFSEENIIMANREQASLFLEASRYRVKRLRATIQAEAAYDTEKANAALYFRRQRRSVKRSTTEAEIKEQVVIDEPAQAARAKYDKAQVYEEWAKLLLEAYRQRGHAIKTLAEILGAEANAQARIARKDLEVEGFERLKSAVRKKYPGSKEN
jgi:hypothetical protein